MKVDQIVVRTDDGERRYTVSQWIELSPVEKVKIIRNGQVSFTAGG